MSPQREVLNKLARDDYNVVDRRTRVYFRDVYDHYVRLQDILESLRDLVTGALDIYLSVVNNRMNDVMKTLTVITTLFMPVSFLAGFLGMNFFTWARPFSLGSGTNAFWLTLGAMVLTTAGMFWWMRQRKWM
jgi:magnesium transporter